MAEFDLSGYNTVPERIAEFREKYPEGMLRPANPDEPFRMIDVGDSVFVAYTAAAYRHPDDTSPGIGCAWEPVPGPTKFTRNSELQNAETAAWGRAIIAVGAADAKKGIATQTDVQNRMAEEDWYQSPEYAEQQAIPGLRSSVQAAIDKLDDDEKAALKAWFEEKNLPPVKRMNAAQADMVIEHLLHPDEVAA